MTQLQRKASQDLPDAPTIEEKVVEASGDITYKKYSRGRFLGKGGFAKVYEVINLQTKHVSAAKLIGKGSLGKARARQKLMSEIKIHRSLHHDNIVGFEHFFEDADYVYILLELCPNQSLSDLMRRRKRLTELEAKCYTHQVIAGLMHLHSHKVIHRDIKLGNLFLNDKMVVKLGDFGLATKLEFDTEKKRTICGTPNYIAPEILEGKQGHSYEVDVWSLGVLLYTFVVGKPPFETNDVKTTYRRIKMNAYSFPEHVVLSEDVKNLISSILLTEPAARPSFADILNHPFFSTPFPKTMPASCLAVPPSAAYLKQFQAQNAKERQQTVPLKHIGSPERVPGSPNAAGGKRTATFSAYKGVRDGPSLWVKKWVDYSSKYGLGYVLANGSVGVYFNDSTKIVSVGERFQYIHRQGANRDEAMAEYSLRDFPSELKKKVTLLEHFRKHLGTRNSEGTEFVYIKKWLTTSHAMVFRLSNKVVQVAFQDRTELLLCTNSKRVTYVDKQGEVTVHALKTAGDSSHGEMTRRLKYTKEVLTNMLSNSPDGLRSN